jgi:hypothetical protein
VAYESPLPALVFVRVPNERGRYMLTDRCVVEAPCPSCQSIKGEPCKSGTLYTVGVHWNRRMGAERRKPGDGPPKAILRSSDIADATA